MFTNMVVRQKIPEEREAFVAIDQGQYAVHHPFSFTAVRHRQEFSKTIKPFKPRGGLKTGFADWHGELHDIIAQYGLSDIAKQKLSISAIMERYPSLSREEATERLAAILPIYQPKNTALFWIVKGSIDLTGPHSEADKEHIRDHFEYGDLRDGKGLLDWVCAFSDTTTDENQEAFQAQLHTKLPVHADYASFVRHCNALWSAWRPVSYTHLTLPTKA